MTRHEGVDADGYIVTEVSRANIPARYEALLTEADQLLKAAFPDHLHSLYLYGSVAMGKAAEGKSDLDLLAVFTNPVGGTEQLAVWRIAGELGKEWRHLVREVGIEVADVEEITGPKNPAGWGCFLKHLCVCLDGVDLSQRFEKFRPSREVAWGLNSDIADRIEEVQRKLAEAEDGEATANLCASVSRRLVRVGFGLVMAKDRVWTTDLRRSSELFCERYPDKGLGMRRVSEWTYAPSSSKKEVLDFLEGVFVSWLLAEFGQIVAPRTL